eukprot:6459010-Amphidinium_carterae.1
MDNTGCGPSFQKTHCSVGDLVDSRMPFAKQLRYRVDLPLSLMQCVGLPPPLSRHSGLSLMRGLTSEQKRVLTYMKMKGLEASR